MSHLRSIALVGFSLLMFFSVAAALLFIALKNIIPKSTFQAWRFVNLMLDEAPQHAADEPADRTAYQRS
ncbi:MAG: hypothetical protein U0930_09035 [Pirellulales bacterium]